jgi:diadenosine tetraphosphate (Ap4A) HIT family hydrolase
MVIHPQLLNDTVILGKCPLSHLLLMNDANYPWCILVPDRENISEIFQLTETDQQQLLQESVLLAQTMMNLFMADKMNVAALGNVVPQLHLHHVARFRNDAAWPAPVWGKVRPVPYAEKKLSQIASTLLAALSDLCEPDARWR